MGEKSGVEGLQTILGRVSFPADKDEIISRARSSGADDGLLGALRAMPPVVYERPDEVLRSVPVDESGTDARDESRRAQQRRHHTKPGLAETMKETEPVNPIEEETGENRKG
ncbi:DUF2795 domain-containing protein [Nocardiopsis sp. MG754419]|uniref:DUF2795 domain-containing protein n=1 Tax=Nocardiopsis sp. MG754419 TaxID=2259865 RepID=UPI001BA4BA29|nr:DUF2795 domain-containing protein [Nocardiopsis sp. MG754419]MBR8744111.1 DUF2795 domain-containing protein [Nocardiopsis sp. MG754419]